MRALILTPTRELAVQVEESFRTYGKYTNLRSTVVYGGVDIKQQLGIVRGGVEILVATPGRLLDHIEHKSVYLGQVEIFVLDEADRMLDMGFIPDIKRIMALLPVTAKRQNLLFSATFSGEIKKLADQLLNAPQLIEVAKRNTAADTVSQFAYKVPADAKRALLEHLVRSRNLDAGAVLHAHQARRLAARAAAREGRPASPTRSTATRPSRRGWRRSPRSRKASCRCSSPPTSPRAASTSTTCRSSSTTSCRTSPKTTSTGSAAPAAPALSGEAISFVAPEEERYLADIERLLKKTVQIVSAEGFDPSNVRAERSPRSSSRAAAPDRPPRAARSEHASRPPRAPRAEPGTETRVARPPREDPRVERERAYALNPDQPVVARPPSAAEASGSALASSRTHAKRHGFGHGRPVPALLKKRSATEPEKV